MHGNLCKVMSGSLASVVSGVYTGYFSGKYLTLQTPPLHVTVMENPLYIATLWSGALIALS